MSRRRVLVGAAAAVLALVVGGSALGRPGNGHGPRKVVLNGVVGQLSATGFTLHRRGHGRDGSDVTVVTSPTTSYRKTDGSAASAADVVVGAKLQVKGGFEADGATVDAAKVLVKVPDSGDDGP